MHDLTRVQPRAPTPEVVCNNGSWLLKCLRKIIDDMFRVEQVITPKSEFKPAICWLIGIDLSKLTIPDTIEELV